MKYTWIILIVLLTISCRKFIEETPKGSLIPKTVDEMGMILANETEINVGIGNTLAFSNDLLPVDALAAGYSQADINAIRFTDYIYGANENDNDWNRLYHSISLCNFVADNIDNAPGGVDHLHDRNTVKGNALFHRAYSYFLLVNEYAQHYNPTSTATDKGVPLLLHLDINLTATRATVKEVYDQMISDVQQAADLLPSTSPFSFNATKTAARSLLANIYLHQGKFAEAWQTAQTVTQVMNLKDYNTVFRNTTTDPRNGFINLDPMEWKREETIYHREHVGMLRNLLFITNDLLNTYDKINDRRYILFLTTRVLNIHSAWGVDRNSGISLGDIYLVEAEARVRDTNTSVADALVVLNKFIRSRYKTGYPAIVTTDRMVLKQRILEERRKEFAYRGLRLFEIKRLAVQDNRQETIFNFFGGNTYTIAPGGNKTVLPIPLNVIAKSNMEQNPR
jgi:starch-binding outer membrane protein, SusD/RagB family